MKISAVVVALILLFVGYSLGHQTTQVVTVTDTVTLADLERRLESEKREVSRLRGINRSQPDTVFITDTVIPPPDTIITFVSVRDGRLTTSWLIGDSLYAPSMTVNRIGGCDDGFEVSAAGVLCDRAVLGHLYVGPLLDHTDPMLAVFWKPSYRSPWEVGAGYGTRLHLYVRYGLRLF